MKNLLIPILIVALVLGGITLDYTHHGANTWISHALFWPALAYVALVVVQAFRGTPKGPAAVLLLLGAAAASCQQLPTREQQAETDVAAAADTIHWSRRPVEVADVTYRTADGYDALKDTAKW